ncbi:MAG: hypothetical protein KDK91_06470 [Gammaproteobacteria bacterium]|nr:hypothetical protein [Gammaproteobacteria bacterium]
MVLAVRCKGRLRSRPLHRPREVGIFTSAIVGSFDPAVTICFLALLLHRIVRRQLKAKSSPYSVERMLNRLRAIQLHQVQFGERSWRGLTKMTTEQLKLFETLEVTKPTADALK